MTRASRALAAAALALSCLASVSGTALGEPAGRASRVAVYRPRGSSHAIDATLTRLRAELLAAGFTVDVEELDPDVGAREQAARGMRDAAAVVVIGADDATDSLDVWLGDANGKPTAPTHLEAPASEPESAAVVALRAVEVVRASLVDVASSGESAPGPAPTPAPAPPPAPADRSVAPARAHATRRPLLAGVAAGASVATLIGLPGLTPGFAPLVHVSAGLGPHLAVRASFAGPTLGERISAAGGSASTLYMFGSAETLLTTDAPEARLVPIALLGVGAAYVSVDGSGAPPNLGRHDATASLTVAAGAGVALRVGDRAAFVVDARALVLTPRPEVRIAGATADGGSPVTAVGTLGFLTSL